MSAPLRLNRFRTFVSPSQGPSRSAGRQREMVFSDRRLLSPSVASSGDLTLELRVDLDRLVRAGVPFDPKTARAFAMVPAADGAWARVELDFVLVTEDLERPTVSFSGSSEVGLAHRDGVAFGLDVPGLEATRVWAQRHGENTRPG